MFLPKKENTEKPKKPTNKKVEEVEEETKDESPVEEEPKNYVVVLREMKVKEVKTEELEDGSIVNSVIIE